MSGFDILGGIKQEPKLIGGLPHSETPGGEGDSDFAATLDGALNRVRNLQLDSKDKVEALGRGEDVELHDVMLAMGKSEVAFNMMLEVRNKILEAWQKLSTSVS